tara:strand:+ start:8600 stop:8776 length:177 start_codon:yes stop_codon:yes gene_type:complete
MLSIIKTDKELKQTPQDHQGLSEKELRKLSDKEFKVYCSKVTSELVWSFKEVRKNEDY